MRLPPGGPIGKVRGGNRITISGSQRSIDIGVPVAEPAARDGVGFRVPASGYLDTFRYDARDMSTGGVLRPVKD